MSIHQQPSRTTVLAAAILVAAVIFALFLLLAPPAHAGRIAVWIGGPPPCPPPFQAHCPPPWAMCSPPPPYCPPPPPCAPPWAGPGPFGPIEMRPGPAPWGFPAQGGVDYYHRDETYSRRGGLTVDETIRFRDQFGNSVRINRSGPVPPPPRFW